MVSASPASESGAVEVKESRRSPSVELLLNLTLREIRSQYKRTALGRLWSFVTPLATIATYSLVFGVLFETGATPSRYAGVHNFALWLAGALLSWNFISNGVVAGMNALVSNASLLNKVYFPRWIPVVSTVLALVVTLATELGVLAVVMLIFGGPLVLLMIPVVLVMMAITAVFVIGVALTLSILMVHFRDTQYFMTIFMQVWFFLTPIIYDITLVGRFEDRLAANGWNIPIETIWTMNPAYLITDSFRSLLYDFTIPGWGHWVGLLLWAGGALGIGLLVFRKFSKRVVEDL